MKVEVLLLVTAVGNKTDVTAETTGTGGNMDGNVPWLSDPTQQLGTGEG